MLKNKKLIDIEDIQSNIEWVDKEILDTKNPICKFGKFFVSNMWNGSFHEADYYLVTIKASAICKIDKRFYNINKDKICTNNTELKQIIDTCEEQAIKFWELSRKS